MARRQIAERAMQVPGVVATDEEILFIDNVLPSFITSWTNADNDTYLFFVDGLSNNAIYRAALSGNDRNLTRISSNVALHLVVIGDSLFYANYNNNNILYRIDLNTLSDRAALLMPVYGATTDGEHLFFLSGDEGGPYGVFSLHPDDPATVRHLANGAGPLLKYEREYSNLYFTTPEGGLRGITQSGEPVVYHNNINVQAFTFDGDWLVFIEPGQLQPRVKHIRTGDIITLDTPHRLSYIWARRGVVYGIDHIRNTTPHMVQLPEGL